MTRLEAIVRRVEAGEATIAESIELVAEGKGLERALREYLDRCQAELARVEEADGPGRYRVVGVRAEETPPPGS